MLRLMQRFLPIRWRRLLGCPQIAIERCSFRLERISRNLGCQISRRITSLSKVRRWRFIVLATPRIYTKNSATFRKRYGLPQTEESCVSCSWAEERRRRRRKSCALSTELPRRYGTRESKRQRNGPCGFRVVRDDLRCRKK